MVDALQHLWDTVPGLYQAGLSKDTVARMFVAPRKGTHAATNYVGAVDARVANKRNNASTCDHNTHWARVQVKLLMEFQAFHQQLNFSGDDMNVIQVGRPAVSRYHNTRKFYMTDEGVDYEVHDWPTAELGLKLGGFMLLKDMDNADEELFSADDELDVDFTEEIP